jgi:N-acetylmuramoyl-L-alanine amidase
MFSAICRGWQKIMIVGLLVTGICGSALAQDGYISARSFAESQGIAYQWFPIQKILVMRKGVRSVKLIVNEKTAVVDEVEVPMPAPAKIQDGQIMVPATAMTRFFQVSNSPEPAPQIIHEPPAQMQPIAVTPAMPAIQISPDTPAVIPQPQIQVENDSEEAILVALRHSSREDHTRVVLEFSNQITYRSDFKDGVYKLTINGCRNLIPTKRTNPSGRDVSKLDINSGPERKGLVLTFHLQQKTKQPTIETVATPFRMIVSIPAPDAAIATATAAITASAPVAVAPAKPSEPKVEAPPEISIDVPMANLGNPAFAGRTIIIDPGHGGSDKGAVIAGRPDEKTITLSLAQHLKAALEARGLRAVMTRTGDMDMNQQQRIAFANRHGGDLYVSLHTGSTNDAGKAGFAVYTYSKSGTATEEKKQGLNYASVYNEWLKSSRFDLGALLANKISERISLHLKAENRGVKSLPVLPLKFILNPAVLVETGMLSDKVEGKNLISDSYRKAIAQSIANAVVDFFNSITVNP